MTHGRVQAGMRSESLLDPRQLRRRRVRNDFDMDVHVSMTSIRRQLENRASRTHQQSGW
jgi:hypothetical protein